MQHTNEERKVRTAFSVFSSSSWGDMRAKSVTFSCGRNWHKLPTWIPRWATSCSTYKYH